MAQKRLSLVIFFNIPLFVFILYSREKKSGKKMPCSNIYLIDVMVSDLHCLNSFRPTKKCSHNKKKFSSWQQQLESPENSITNAQNRSKCNNRKNWNHKNTFLSMRCQLKLLVLFGAKKRKSSNFYFLMFSFNNLPS